MANEQMLRSTLAKISSRVYVSHLLNDSASIRLHSKVCELALHYPGQHLLLDLAAVLEEFLDDVVAKNVLHELDSIGLDLSEDLVLLVAVRRLELLLNEPRTLLIAAELHDIRVDILKVNQKVSLGVLGTYKVRASLGGGGVVKFIPSTRSGCSTWD